MTKSVLLTILIAVFGVAAQGPGNGKQRSKPAPKEPTRISSPSPVPSPGFWANAGPDLTVYAGESVRLDGTASTNVVGNSWTTGDGYTIDSILKAPHAYTVPGTYIATLTIIDSVGNLSSDSAVVTV
ncbi:MAG TPA: PKD domain-containing protein, partial [Pirellula sp.]|nr:PKD domain-containing protein [Pirellula sp.]